MNKTENLKRVLPFSVEVVAKVEGKINVELPATIQTRDGNYVMIPIDNRIITVDPGSNMSHNIGRDVRAEIRKINLLVSSKDQASYIEILNLHCNFVLN